MWYSLSLFAGGLVVVALSGAGAVILAPAAATEVIVGTAFGALGVWVVGFFTSSLAALMRN